MDENNHKNGSIAETDALEAAKKPEGSKKKEKLTGNKLIREILSYLLYIAIAVVIALLWRTFVLTKVEVVSGSMQNTLMKDDRLIVSKLPYIFGKVQRGDIVVFHYPDDETQIYVKRVIGLPGEVVDIVNGQVFIDGVLYHESYLGSTDSGSWGPYTVPSGCYFVLGDNRSNSKDSRFWSNTYVMDEEIVGKALFRYKPKIEKLYDD